MELLDGDAVENSEWLDCRLLTELVFQVEGVVAGDVVQVQGTNQNPNGVASPVTDQIGADITDDGFTNVTELPGWVRVRRSDITGGGTVVVNVSARQM